MKKVQNDWLHVLGIILSLVGLAAVLQPLIRAIFGKPLSYLFLGLLPEGWPSFAAWAVILAIGLVLVSITERITTHKPEYMLFK
ncbi:hypothetical protein FHS16_004121 [Paenibacillus endophyticus]|uniref:Uncharacterized protein n=1 Tax=Paenibacillus endophyticus TaxID=1294268 RepID=A0A7W5GBP5_9BACL|nr:hypothetical protein [Paenibacillus endophyticus]MBB3154045.1 hypothetical protein [Paenibacillus endophyticus]